MREGVAVRPAPTLPVEGTAAGATASESGLEMAEAGPSDGHTPVQRRVSRPPACQRRCHDLMEGVCGATRGSYGSASSAAAPAPGPVAPGGQSSRGRGGQRGGGVASKNRAPPPRVHCHRFRRAVAADMPWLGHRQGGAGTHGGTGRGRGVDGDEAGGPRQRGRAATPNRAMALRVPMTKKEIQRGRHGHGGERGKRCESMDEWGNKKKKRMGARG